MLLKVLFTMPTLNINFPLIFDIFFKFKNKNQLSTFSQFLKGNTFVRSLNRIFASQNKFLCLILYFYVRVA